jgi:cytochrome c oxidase subunit 3
MTQAEEHKGEHAGHGGGGGGGGDHGHGGHGHGSPFVQHHYDDAQHQFDSGKLGVWFFLAQEILFFSALFVAYILYRHHRPEIFEYAHHYLDVKWGAINTAVLIISSLSAAWAVRCAQLRQHKGLLVCIVITLACACGFLVIKYIEYSHKIHEGILFGNKFDPCVSSGGSHLVNRKNDCAGIKSTVTWDAAARKAEKGCLDPNVDQDPSEPGWQVDCLVSEVAYRIDNQGGKKTKTETGRRDIPACVFAATEAQGRHAAHHKPTNPPCWIVQHNHLVCPKAPAILVLYGDHKVRDDRIEIDAKCNPRAEAIASPDDDPFAEKTFTFEKSIDPQKKLTKHELSEQLASGPPPENTNMFFSIYFAMTGLHGIHVLVGVFIWIWLLIRAAKHHFTPDYFGPIDYAALYWHLVDLIWIFLFPLLYLIH